MLPLYFNRTTWLLVKKKQEYYKAIAIWSNTSEGNSGRWLLNHFCPGAAILCSPVATMKVICPILIIQQLVRYLSGF